MLRTVHEAYVAIILIILNCGFCSCLLINQEDEVTDDGRYNNLDLETFQVLEPWKTNKNNVEIIPEDDNGLLFTTIKTKQNQNEDLSKDTIIGAADKIIKHRKTRQANHGYTALYPQIPSGPPYNPYQQQPSYNPPGQNPYPQQPSYNPSGQNPHPQQPSYNPPSQNQYPQQPAQWNPHTYNSSQSGNTSPYTSKPNTLFQNSSLYNPSTSQNPYNSHPTYPSYNNSSPGNPYSPPNGQYPAYNHTLNNPSHTGTLRPPNSGPSFTTAWPPYNPRPGQNFNNNSYPGQPPVNNNYPNYPHSYDTHTQHPVIALNSTSRTPPYNSNYPSQYPAFNNSRANYPPQGPSATNYPYPNIPGVRPSLSNNNVSNGQYPHYLPSPYSNNATSFPKPSPPSPYYPGQNGQYSSNTNTNFNSGYPQSNGYSFANTYNPSIPNYPPQNNNQGQNNFYYPQRNNTEYDPSKVQPHKFSYH